MFPARRSSRRTAGSRAPPSSRRRSSRRWPRSPRPRPPDPPITGGISPATCCPPPCAHGAAPGRRGPDHRGARHQHRLARHGLRLPRPPRSSAGRCCSRSPSRPTSSPTRTSTSCIRSGRRRRRSGRARLREPARLPPARHPVDDRLHRAARLRALSVRLSDHPRDVPDAGGQPDGRRADARRGRSALFWRVALPLARPAVAIGASLALMEALNDIGASEFLGVRTLTVSIYTTWVTRIRPAGAAQIALAMLSSSSASSSSNAGAAASPLRQRRAATAPPGAAPACRMAGRARARRRRDSGGRRLRHSGRLPRARRHRAAPLRRLSSRIVTEAVSTVMMSVVATLLTVGCGVLVVYAARLIADGGRPSSAGLRRSATPCRERCSRSVCFRWSPVSIG
jgi:hypothetical protein